MAVIVSAFLKQILDVHDAVSPSFPLCVVTHWKSTTQFLSNYKVDDFYDFGPVFWIRVAVRASQARIFFDLTP